MKPMKSIEPKTMVTVWRNPYQKGSREARVETMRVVREAGEDGNAKAKARINRA